MTQDIADRLKQAIETGQMETSVLTDALAEIERLRAVAGKAQPSDFNDVKKEARQ